MHPLPSQELRTFFVSSTCHGHSSKLQTDQMKALLYDHLDEQRKKNRTQLHEFVLMPDHVHLLITPMEELTLEKCMQYIKGGFSFKVKKVLGKLGEVWQAGYKEHRIKDFADYLVHVKYIHENPVKRGLVMNAEDYQYSSASMRDILDPAPLQYRG